MVFLLCEFSYVVSDLKTKRMFYHISHNEMVFLLCEFSYVVSDVKRKNILNTTTYVVPNVRIVLSQSSHRNEHSPV